MIPFFFLSWIALAAPISANDTATFRAKIVEHNLTASDIVFFIDYSKPIDQRRFYAYDVKARRTLYMDYVGHARASGVSIPTSFSNVLGTNMSSLGVYRVGEQYESATFGRSVRLHGLSTTNSRARERAIVIHDVKGGIVVTNSRFEQLYSKGCFTFFNAGYGRLLQFLRPGRTLVVYQGATPAL